MDAQRWEYRIEKLSHRFKSGDADAAKRLNELGAEGWEAVGITGDIFRESGVLLKRPVGQPDSSST